MRDENPTVYSTSSGRICPKCGHPIAQCVCNKRQAQPVGDGVVRIQRQSKGRKGKTVTLVTGLPLSGDDLHALLTDLKRQCGSGGTVKDGAVEIQGDHRDVIFTVIKKRGYLVKLAGG